MKYRCLIVVFIFISLTSKAERIIEFNNSDILEIGNLIAIYEDPTNLLTANEVLQIDSFVENNQKTPNLGITSSTFWILLNIKNNTNTKNLVLQLSNPILNQADLYEVSNNKSSLQNKLGDDLPYTHRAFNHQKLLYYLSIEPNTSKKYLLKIKSWEQISLNISIGNPEKIYESTLVQDLIFGIYFGIIISLVLYNLFIFITVKDTSYLYYIIFILFVALTQATLQGYTFRFIWPNSPNYANNALIIFPAIAGIATCRFIVLFLKTKTYTPILHKGIIGIVILYIFSISAKLLGFNNLSFRLTDLNAAILTFYALTIAVTISLKGYRPAKFFLLAWTLFLIGIIFFVMQNTGVLPSNNFTNYTMPLGSAIETILLSFALADKINIYKKEKEELILNQNIVLERTVIERTLTLENTLVDLKEAQSQLVDAEKMSSLGQLTAGIAHEINNPINFVSSNIPPLKQDLDDINAIIKKYEEITPHNITEKLKEIEALKTELDFEYLKIELPTIISGIEDGAKRTQEIVSGLRNFSRLDEIELQSANINEGIESTLVLIKNKLHGIQLTKNLGAIPSIECYPGKLNQLFMNVLDNAIGAIETKKSDKVGEIILSTYNDSNFIYFKITDNGIGMDATTKNKMFEPFYTTKPVGSGTGLGLSIVHTIIKNHKGEIEVITEENIGTQITIKFPIKQ